jgi:hypothetical protein
VVARGRVLVVVRGRVLTVAGGRSWGSIVGGSLGAIPCPASCQRSGRGGRTRQRRWGSQDLSREGSPEKALVPRGPKTPAWPCWYSDSRPSCLGPSGVGINSATHTCHRPVTNILITLTNTGSGHENALSATVLRRKCANGAPERHHLSCGRAGVSVCLSVSQALGATPSLRHPTSRWGKFSQQSQWLSPGLWRFWGALVSRLWLPGAGTSHTGHFSKFQMKGKLRLTRVKRLT